ncbi:MAG TPA: hypothetical protein VGP72_06295 [Planctomycetota bacterium]
MLAVQHAVAEIAGGRKVDADPSALCNAVLLLRKAVRQINGAYACFIGGLAVQEHGYVRWTDDVDIVVDAEHFSEVIEKLREMGFAIEPNFALRNKETGATVDVLKEGTTLKGAHFPLPHPSELGPNCGFATLPAVIRLKLDAHRRQDLADVVQLLKSHLPQIDDICSQLPEAFRTEFLQLADEARRELQP